MGDSNFEQPTGRKCRCDGTSGTECHWCQGTGYEIQEIRFYGTKPTQSSKTTQRNLKPENQNSAAIRAERYAKRRKNDSLLDQIRSGKGGDFDEQKLKRTSIEPDVKKIAKEHFLEKYFVCEGCHNKIDSVHFTRHQKKCKALNQKNAKRRPDRKYSICEGCRAFIRIENVESHKEKCKVKTPKENGKNVAPKSTDNKKGLGATYVICTNCDEKTNLAHLNSHKKKCTATKNKAKNIVNKNASEPGSKNQPLAGQEKDTARTNSSINIEIHDTRRDYKYERNLDGSREYYITRKEGGRYGSHSMYDDMGDESNS